MRELIDEREALLDETEEEEKKKEEKAALYYFTAAYMDRLEKFKKKAALDDAWATRIRNDFFAKMQKEKLLALAIEYKKHKELLEHYEAAVNNLRNYFELDSDDLLKEQLEEDLSEIKLDRNSFAALSLCATNEKFDKVCQAMMNKQVEEEVDSEFGFDSLKTIRKSCMEEACNSLHDYRFGKHERMAKLLAKGLKQGCKFFANAKDDNTAVEMSAYVCEMMHVLKSNPKLIKLSGLSEKQLKIAEGAAALGDDIRKGVMAVELLMASSIDPSVKLTEQQRRAMIDNAVKMKTAIANKQELIKEWDVPEKLPVAGMA